MGISRNSWPEGPRDISITLTAEEAETGATKTISLDPAAAPGRVRKVRLPGGLRNGATLRIPNPRTPGDENGGTGYLYLKIVVEPLAADSRATRPPRTPEKTAAAPADTKEERSRLVSPAHFVAPGRRLFIDTNIFMDTDPAKKGRLKRLLEHCSARILKHKNPVIIPTKVVDELTKHSQLDPASLSADRARAAAKAAMTLKLLRDAESKHLFRTDLGNASNPYADDLFVRVFQDFGDQYEMCLLTNDITLLLRIRMLALSSPRPQFAGELTRDGMIKLDSPQKLFRRGSNKLQRKLEEGDQREAAVLEPLLRDFQHAFDVKPAETEGAGTHPGQTAHRNASVAGDTERAFQRATAAPEPDRKLDTATIPGTGDRVLFESSADCGALILGEKLGEGGEGAVFTVGGGQAAKIFDREHITLHRKKKIGLLAGRGLDQAGICFPRALVTNEAGEFVGYLMPQARGQEFQKALLRPVRFKRTYPHWKKSDLVDVCISFLEKVAYLHSLNIIIGDINPKNLMVGSGKEVWIIDADSWQLEGYPCPVGTPMFTAPTALGKPYADHLRTMEEERFAIATMLFMILITGQFPYSRAGSDGDIVKLIQEGNFAFQYKGNSNRDQPEGNWKYMWSHLQPTIKGMFWNTFHRDGNRYHSRPSAKEWLQAFLDYKRWLESGTNFDPMSNDVYPTRFRAMAADTPLYACARCNTSMAGIWDKKTETYRTPRFCRECEQNRQKCLDCGRTAGALRGGRCRDCNRSREYGNCADCSKEVPRKYLVSGHCSGCQPAGCKRCGMQVRKSTMSHGRCPECHEWSNSIDLTRWCTRCGRTFITNGNVEWHQAANKPVPKSHRTEDPACQPPPRVSRPAERPWNAAPSRPASQQGLWNRITKWMDGN